MYVIFNIRTGDELALASDALALGAFLHRLGKMVDYDRATPGHYIINSRDMVVCTYDPTLEAQAHHDCAMRNMASDYDSFHVVTVF